MSLPAFIPVDNTIALKILDDEHAAAIFELVKTNKNYLVEWLPWVEKMTTLQHFINFVTESKRRFANQADFAYGIFLHDKIVGRIGIYNVDDQNKLASVGYWLSHDYKGKGLVTRACKALISQTFAHMNLNRVEIRCGTENYKSQSVPERLGFVKEGIIRQAEYVNNRFINLYCYSMLKEEWQAETDASN